MSAPKRFGLGVLCVGLLIFAIVPASFADEEGDGTTIVVPVEGTKVYKETLTKKVAETLTKRIGIAKMTDIDIFQSSTAAIRVVHKRPLSNIEKIVLTSSGSFEVREILSDSEFFDVLLSEFKSLAPRRDGGIRSVCATERSTLDDALRRIVGPDAHFAVFEYPSVGAWCALALGKKALRNDAVMSVAFKKSVQGERTLSIKIDPNHAARLAENGELDVKTLGITIDGDLIARSTLGQVARRPVTIVPPTSLKTDALRRRWLLMIHALLSARIPAPVVLLEDD